MDIKEMREVAESVSEYYSCDCDPQIGIWSCPQCEARYLAKLMLVLTCPDPLTLDAAVVVMGREPDGVKEHMNRVSYRWDMVGCDAKVIVWKEDGAVQVSVFEYWHMKPTIGKFACLVVAARVGEKA